MEVKKIRQKDVSEVGALTLITDNRQFQQTKSIWPQVDSLQLLE